MWCWQEHSLLPPYQVIAGYDYKQEPLNSSAECTRACCAESQCVAWAVAKGMCWLKNGWSFEARAYYHVKVLCFDRYPFIRTCQCFHVTRMHTRANV